MDFIDIQVIANMVPSRLCRWSHVDSEGYKANRR